MSVQETIRTKLERACACEHLEVLNESHKHRTAPGAETHFRIVLVSSGFEGLSSIARHRMVHQILADELREGVHALALQLHTPLQWAQSGSTPAESPACAHKGGGASEASSKSLQVGGA